MSQLVLLVLAISNLVTLSGLLLSVRALRRIALRLSFITVDLEALKKEQS